jgi:hypothetical protein
MSYSLDRVLALARNYKTLYGCSNREAAYLAITEVRS